MSQPRFDPIHIGNDFNVSAMAAACAELHNGKLYVMREFIGLQDTPELIDAIKEAFPSRKIFSYPDSTGAKRGTTNANVSDISILRDAKFTVRARSINPSIKDRIAAVNRAFEKNKLFINTHNCPELTEALEQQVYSPNGKPDKESGLDHIVDALGYMVHYIMPVQTTGVQRISVAH
ncbi:MAG: hypothetical protein GY696_25100 [Gammaproteobacteria bacterium]|nr:hypothetical protein [Gammaproteobacteria bacterium]